MKLLFLLKLLLPQPYTDQRQVDQVVNASSFGLVQGEHPAYHTLELFTVPHGDSLELAFFYSDGEGHWVLSLKRRMQRTQLIDDAP